MSPMEVDLSCDLRRPRFYIRSNESECKFEFRTKEFVQKSTDKLRYVFFFYHYLNAIC